MLAGSVETPKSLWYTVTPLDSTFTELVET